MRDCVTDDNNSDRLSVHSILFPLRFPFEYLVVRSVGQNVATTAAANGGLQAYVESWTGRGVKSASAPFR